MAARDEFAVLKYAVWQDIFEQEKPYKVMSDLIPGSKKTNITYKDGSPQLFRDVRGKESSYNLDEHGFQFGRHVTNFSDWHSEKAVEEHYFPEVEEVLRKEIPGITKVHIFDWRLRRNETFEEAGIEKIDLTKGTSWFPPVSTAHIDQTLWSSRERVNHHLPDEARRLDSSRLRIINVWRPIKHVVEDWPLAVCDGSNVVESDLLATDYVTLRFVGETYNVMFRDKYRWHYLSYQTPEEVTLLKISDSRQDIQARRESPPLTATLG
jgi:hypothetical protein